MLMIFINTPSRSHSYISQWEHSRIKTIWKGIAGAARQQTWYTSNAGEFTFPMGVLNISFWFSWNEGFVLGRKRRIGRPWGRSCYWYCASLKASSLVSDSPNQSAPRASDLLSDLKQIPRWRLLSLSLLLLEARTTHSVRHLQLFFCKPWSFISFFTISQADLLPSI